MTDRSHFEENPLDPKQWRTMTDLERYSSLQRLQIAHPRLKPLIKELDSYAYFSEQVSQGAPQSLAIMGEVGVGKTTLVRSWIETATLRQSMPSAERPTIPFVFCTLPANPTSKGILAACLSALGDPRPTYGGEWTMMERLQRLVRTSSVRMLFIDELQHLLNLETRRVRHAGVELLEQIINQTGVPVVFLGSQWETEAIIRASPRLEQLVGAPRILRPFEWNRNHPETILEFRSLMRAIDHHLPFDPSGLEEEDMAYRFYLASDGIIGWITKLIHYAAGEAIHMQAATLSRSLLAAAYETCIANTTIGMGKLNPFTMQHVPWEPNGARFLGNETFPLAIKQQRKRMVKEPKSAAMENEQQHSKRTIDEE